MMCGLDMVRALVIGPSAAGGAPDNQRGRPVAFVASSLLCLAAGCTVHGPVGDATDDRGAEMMSEQAAPPPVAPPPQAAPPDRDEPDPGAAALVAQLDAALEGLRSGPGGLTSIGLSALTNRSTASAREFDSLVGRLESLLDAAGAASGLDFYTDPAEPVDFELRGTAYLMSVAGFDHWEIFLELRPGGSGWSIWNSPGPIRLLRTPARGAAPQIMMPRPG